MMKFFYTFLLAAFFSPALWAYRSPEIKAFMNAECAEPGSGMHLLSEAESPSVIRHLSAWSRARQSADDREKYRILSAGLEEDRDFGESEDVDLMLSATEIMLDIVYCSRLGEKIAYGKESKKLFERVLSLQPESVPAMIGVGIGFLHTPAVFGGSDQKAFEWFSKARAAAAEPYERYTADVWLSQYYFKIGDEENYRLFIGKAQELFPDGYLLTRAVERNENERKPL